MSVIHQVAGTDCEVRLNILFFHGLNGHHQETWTCPGKEKVFWPSWLAEDAPGVRVSSVEYDASPTRWRSDGMTLTDRAANVASQIAVDATYCDAPLALIGHSLGGNVIKAIIRHLKDHRSTNPRYDLLLKRIRLVVFLGTPHTGATIHRKIPIFIQKLLRFTKTVDELDLDSPILRDLTSWYRSNILPDSKHMVFVEAKPTVGGALIVSPSSADPGIPNVTPIPVDSNHSSICKPNDRSGEVYKLILDAIQTVMADQLPEILQDPPSILSSPAEKTQRRRRGVDMRIEAHRKSLMDAGDERPFTILLCGPTIKESDLSPAAQLCSKIKNLLESDGFQVVIGQSQGMTDSRLGDESNTLGRELNFIGNSCNAVVVIASGAAGWSELGLFGWHMASNKSIRAKGVDIVVIADSADAVGHNFLASGPVAYGEAVGRADITSLQTYNPETVLHRMRARRSMYVMDRRGRPKRGAA
ncbi:esterase/lipase family protein [Sphingomonas sp. SAFR-052]|uniref:esterase/lipase family protein n=1 Tax=Sphingomonas sp. SAFR-052 TaxID=3436867 RepID=UPI003F7FF577